MITHAAGAETIVELDADGPLLSSEADAVDLLGELYGTGADWLAIPVGRLAPDLFVLSNQKAGFFLQKLVNYGMKAAIVGDIAGFTAQSAPLRDFVRESNRGHHMRFVDTVDALIAERAETSP